MKNLIIPAFIGSQKTQISLNTKKWWFSLSLLFYPIGIIKIWRVRGWLAAKLIYSIFGFVFFLIFSGYLAIVLFASFLPVLDRSVGVRADKTVYNAAGNYSATFLKSGNETQRRLRISTSRVGTSWR